jgi:hypothetical protein
MIVDGEPSSLLEDLQNVFSLSNGFSSAFEKYEGIICILEHGARGIGNQRMFDDTCQDGMMKKLAKNVSNNNKEVRGDMIPLMKTVPIVNPPPKDAVEEDNCFVGAKKLMDPFAPLIRKVVTPKNTIEAIQVNTVECLVEVKFQNDCR